MQRAFAQRLAIRPAVGARSDTDAAGGAIVPQAEMFRRAYEEVASY